MVSVREQARPEQLREQPVPVLRLEQERVRLPVPGSTQPPVRARVLRQEPRQAPEFRRSVQLQAGEPEHKRELRPLLPEE